MLLIDKFFKTLRIFCDYFSSQTKKGEHVCKDQKPSPNQIVIREKENRRKFFFLRPNNKIFINAEKKV